MNSCGFVNEDYFNYYYYGVDALRGDPVAASAHEYFKGISAALQITNMNTQKHMMNAPDYTGRYAFWDQVPGVDNSRWHFNMPIQRQVATSHMQRRGAACHVQQRGAARYVQQQQASTQYIRQQWAAYSVGVNVLSEQYQQNRRVVVQSFFEYRADYERNGFPYDVMNLIIQDEDNALCLAESIKVLKCVLTCEDLKQSTNGYLDLLCELSPLLKHVEGLAFRNAEKAEREQIIANIEKLNCKTGDRQILSGVKKVVRALHKYDARSECKRLNSILLRKVDSQIEKVGARSIKAAIEKGMEKYPGDLKKVISKIVKLIAPQQTS